MREQGHLANQEAQRRLKNLEKNKRRQYDDDIKAVMSSVEGRRFVHRLLFDLLDLTGAIHSTVALELADHNGVRLRAVSLCNEVRRLTPSEFVHMQSEQLHTQENEDLQREGAKDSQEKDE